MRILNEKDFTRRDFIKRAGLSAGAIITIGNFSVIQMACTSTKKGARYKLITVDFTKCTGCRTCEAICSSYNNKVKINGTDKPGLGNPLLSNIKVHRYNPDVDVPVTCMLCHDAPCVEACPVDKDKNTERKALYRDDDLSTIKCDNERCIGCGSCAKACEKERVGVIKPNRETNKPERICTLCSGKPKCVEFCPSDALVYVEGELDKDYSNATPDLIAEKLIKKWY